MSEGVGALLLSQSESLSQLGKGDPASLRNLVFMGSSGPPCLLSTGTDWELKVPGDHIYSLALMECPEKLGRQILILNVHK